MGCGCSKKSRQPSIGRMAVTATAAAVQAAKGQAEKVTEAEYKRRLAVCSGCPDLARFHNLPLGADVGKLDRCALCGCFVKVKAWRKATADAARDWWDCPAEKWS